MANRDRTHVRLTRTWVQSLYSARRKESSRTGLDEAGARGNEDKVFFVHQPHMVEDKNAKFGLGWWGSGIQVTDKGLNNPLDDLGVMST